MALLTELEDKISSLIDGVDKENFIYDFMREMGIPKSTVTKLKKGTKTANMATVPGDIWSNKNVYYRQTSKNVLAEFTDVKSIVDSKQGNTPRIIMVTDFNQLLALDTKTSDTLDIAFNDLPLHFDFFLPWQGIEKVDYEAENPADIKAAERFAKIYDVLFQDNTEIVTVKEGRKTVAKHVFSENTVNETAFNNFLIRALFALFAEDTDIFPRGSFTNVLKTMTSEDGSNMNSVLSELFTVLDQPENMRGDLANWLNQFPYVNGSLFTEPHEDIVFSAKSRKLIIDAGELIDWTQVNPDIFGSMVQAVTGEDDRSHLGMHYTSVPNIMKVIKPLFLDELNTEFKAAYDDSKALDALGVRISKMKFFDPAAGSGNFLIITYKELRRLEIKITKRLSELQGSLYFIYMPLVTLKQFYGIEIEQFAADVAQLSLWIAEHQMNLELKSTITNAVRPTLPLQKAGGILAGNSLRIEWDKVLTHSADEEVFVFGNPPYLGSSLQDKAHKSDLESAVNGQLAYKKLDYIAGWFYKGAQFITGTKSKLAFVTTNSITQGEQVELLWPTLLHLTDISFGYTSFTWNNNAKGNAAVIVEIIGLSDKANNEAKRLYFDNGTSQVVDNISPYLTDGPNVVVKKSSRPLNGLPEMMRGNMPTDGGNLIFSPEERDEAISKFPELNQYIRPFVGAADYINGKNRYVLWLDEDQYDNVKENPIVKQRLAGVKEMRLDSKKASTNALANVPWRFEFISQPKIDNGYTILVPRVSSINRLYVPFGYIDSQDIVSDTATAIYNAHLWTFALIESRMHMVWLRSVGGKLKNDYRYSSNLVYNTFPIPDLSSQRKNELESVALEILDVREELGGDLAKLYRTDTMPEQLKLLHQKLDSIVERAYKKTPFTDDEQRLKTMMNLYLNIKAGE